MQLPYIQTGTVASGRASALWPGGCFDPLPGHTKDFKNGTSCSFAWRSASRTGQLSVSIMWLGGISCQSVWGVIFQWGSTLKVGSLTCMQTTLLSEQASVAQSDTHPHPTGDQEVTSSIPLGPSNFISWWLIKKHFLWSFSPFCWWKKASCQFMARECAQVLVNPCPAEPDMTCLWKQCRSRSVGFWRSQLIWICTVCH